MGLPRIAASIKLSMAVAAPTPDIIVAIAIKGNPGELKSMRTAHGRSCRQACRPGYCPPFAAQDVPPSLQANADRRGRR